MKKVLKIVGAIIGVLILAIAGVAAWVNFSAFPTFPTHSEAGIAIELPSQADSMSLARAANMVQHTCGLCHMGSDGKLSGRMFATHEDGFGDFYAGNITQHPEAGIGKYSDQELAYFLRTGIKRDGNFAGPMMIKPNLSEEDIAAVIQFLRSDDPIVTASAQQQPAPEFSFIGKALFKFGAFSPEAYPAQPVTAPSPNQTVDYGRYLANEVYECFNCHSASFETNNVADPEQSEGLYGGGNMVGLPGVGKIPSPNITMSKTSGIGHYTEAQFLKAVKEGVRPSGHQMVEQLMPQYSSLSDEDVHAIWAYLKTVPMQELQIAVAK